MRHRWMRSGVFAAVAALFLINCLDDSGLNRNERTPGNGEDGIPVWSGEIAIDPTGQYLVTSKGGSIIYGDLESGETRRLSGLTGTTRLAFDHAGETLFATRVAVEAHAEITATGDRLFADASAAGETLVRYDPASGKALWSKPVEIQAAHGDERGLQSYPYLEVTEDDRSLIVTNERQVDVVAADSGKQLRSTGKLPRRVVDVDLTPDQRRLVITLAHRWDQDRAQTLIQVRDLESFELHEIEVPNCADELAITPDGKYAFLAPTTCRRDPVSVIDLEHDEFVRNLPGFGPVALAQEGTLAVAFMDRELLDESLFDDRSQIPTEGARYRLMLIDTASLKFETVELGDEVPRYAVSPNGQLLLVDAPYLWRDGRVRILDTNTRELKQLIGPGLELDNYVITRNSSEVFLLSRGLFRISLEELRVVAEPITFNPTHINITPDDRQLVLREGPDLLWLYDIESSQLKASLNLDL
jgi:hypothetical protein